MKLRHALVATAVIVGAFAPSSAHHGTTSSGSYVGGDIMFPADCSDPSSTLGVVCFEVNETGLSNLHVDVADVSGIPTPAFVELHFASGPTSGGRVCQSGDVPVPPNVTLVRAVVHMEPFAGGFDCGIPGEFHAPVAGHVSVSFS